MAEIENSVMAKQCLSRRIPDKLMMTEETGAWHDGHNEAGASANWQFQAEEARIKLKHLYPIIDA